MRATAYLGRIALSLLLYSLCYLLFNRIRVIVSDVFNRIHIGIIDVFVLWLYILFFGYHMLCQNDYPGSVVRGVSSSSTIGLVRVRLVGFQHTPVICRAIGLINQCLDVGSSFGIVAGNIIFFNSKDGVTEVSELGAL